LGSEGPGGLTPDLDQTPKVGDETWGGEGPQAPASQPASPTFDPFTRPDLAESCGASLLSQKGKANAKRVRCAQGKAVCFFAPHPLIPSVCYQYGVNYHSIASLTMRIDRRWDMRIGTRGGLPQAGRRWAGQTERDSASSGFYFLARSDPFPHSFPSAVLEEFGNVKVGGYKARPRAA